MFKQPESDARVASSSRPPRTLGLFVSIPNKPQLPTVLASIKRKDSRITLPDLSPASRDIPALIEAFKALPDGSDIELSIHQFAVNPHAEPREDLIQLWNAVKYKVKTIIWDQNSFFKSFVTGLTEEMKSDPRVARCEFQNCDKTNSCSADQPNPGFSFPKPEELKAMTFFKGAAGEERASEEECAHTMVLLNEGTRGQI
ncbi:hypothetical protein ACD661_15770 [Legionella lytica]|uniref:Uncharacterized protein n=1 Tax=Legionella lytica TaxID=96232 RepID=A0ABW8DCV3_9GAMM